MKYRLFIWIYNILPRRLRNQLAKFFIELPEFPPDGVNFEVAHSEKDLNQAFTLLHDAMIESGSGKVLPNGMRIPVNLLLPSTAILVAKKEDRVIAMMAIVLNSGLKLPSEKLLIESQCIDKLPGQSRNVEFCSLAIDPKSRGVKGQLLFYLFKFAFEISISIFKADHILAVVRPWRVPLYEAILGFRDISRKSISSPLIALGAKVRVLSLELKDLKLKVYKEYSGVKKKRDIFNFFFNKQESCFQFKEFRFHGAYLRSYNESILKNIFIEKGEVFKQVQVTELPVLLQIFKQIKDRPVGVTDIFNLEAMRRDIRFDIILNGKIENGVEFVPLTILNISKHGLLIQTHMSILKSKTYLAKVSVGPFEIANLKFKIIRSQNDYHGVKIVESCPIWRDFIEFIESSRDQNLSGMIYSKVV